MQCAILKALAPSGGRLASFIRTKPSQELSTIFIIYFSKGTRVEDALMGLKGYRNI